MYANTCFSFIQSQSFFSFSFLFFCCKRCFFIHSSKNTFHSNNEYSIRYPWIFFNLKKKKEKNTISNYSSCRLRFLMFANEKKNKLLSICYGGLSRIFIFGLNNTDDYGYHHLCRIETKL